MKKLKRYAVKTATTSLLMVTLPAISFAQTVTANTDSTKSVAGLTVEKSKLVIGKAYYINSDKVNVRSSDSTTEKNIIGKLSKNDQVAVYNVLDEETPLVQIKILKSTSLKADDSAELFISKDVLSEKQITFPESKYFVIQNIATEKTRVYERCTATPGCPHKMVMETDMVVGRDEGTDEDPNAFKTWVGHAKIAEWVKFYQDGQRHYPNWYRAGQDINDIPKPITKGASKIVSSRQWIATNEHGDSTIYGAFGWYAAKVTPADPVQGMNYQWMHGTIGWGRDGAAAIELTRSFLLNLFKNQGSSGCTRLENRAIAYLRYLLPPGTDIYRVYARETTREKEIVVNGNTVVPLSRYADQVKPILWSYTLLTDGAQQSGGLTADSRTIYVSRIPFARGKNLIEDGSYLVDQYPNAAPLNYGEPAHSGKSGDRYRIDSEDMAFKANSNFRGYFLVDEGRFIDYQHPDTNRTEGKIHVGGLPDFRKSVPDALKTSGAYSLPPRP
ncbi:MAG: hypothetical protein ACXVCP_09910 [Bdellovibrio sp.]